MVRYYSLRMYIPTKYQLIIWTYLVDPILLLGYIILFEDTFTIRKQDNYKIYKINPYIKLITGFHSYRRVYAIFFIWITSSYT